jgi:sucrose-6-phosphate hydrolase SacC (GH32 family)
MKLEMHGKWALLVNDDNTPVTNKTWHECYSLAKEWSVRSGKNLTMIPVREAEKLCSKDRKFKKLLTDYWIHNAEIMKSCKNNEELMKKLRLKTKSVYQWSNENGVSSVRSDWDSDDGCFRARAYLPSGRADYGVAAFRAFSTKRLDPKERKINRKIQQH